MLFQTLAAFTLRLRESSRRGGRRRRPHRRWSVPVQVEQLESRTLLSTLAPGEVHSILSLTEGNHPEGVAVDAEDGMIYVGNRVDTLDENGNPIQTSEILRIDPEDNTASPYAVLPSVDPAASGLLGLATYQGDVYAALASFDFDTQGVYRISNGGAKVELFAGSQFLAFPNAITFDDAGHMYVTDSFGPDFQSGAVWRFDADNPGEPGELWAQHQLLSPFSADDPFLGFGVPLEDPYGEPIPGANGIAFFPAPTPRLYVANTEKGLIAQIPINPDGAAGAVTAVADTGPFSPLGTIDGIQVDVQGNIHGVIPGVAGLRSLGIGADPVVQVDSSTGEITATATDGSLFDVPLSLAFGVSPHDQKSVYVTNGDLIGVAPGDVSLPGLVQVGVGIRGFQVSERDPATSSASDVAPAPTAITFDVSSDDELRLIEATAQRVPDLHSSAPHPAQTPSDLGLTAGDANPFGAFVQTTRWEAAAVDDLFADLDDDFLRSSPRFQQE